MLDKLGCANRAQAACSPATPRYRQPVARVGEAAGWNSGWVPGRPGCVLRLVVRARRVRRASRARRESAAVAIMSLTRSVTSCCRICGCTGSSWVRRAAAGCRAGRSSCRGAIRAGDRLGGRWWIHRGAGKVGARGPPSSRRGRCIHRVGVPGDGEGGTRDGDGRSALAGAGEAGR
jgi:hypothetical protein